MSIIQFFHEFKAPLALLVEAVLIFWLAPAFFVDEFRQKMFALRDQLFSEAQTGIVSFDHPAYGMLRSTMNGYIRFAHRLTLSHTLFLMWRLRELLPAESSFDTKWQKHIATLPSGSRARLETYRVQMDSDLATHLFLSSPLLLALIVPWVIAVVLLRFAVAKVVRILRAPINSLDNAALAIGTA